MKKVRYYKKKIIKYIFTLCLIIACISGVQKAYASYSNLSTDAPSTGVVDNLTVTAYKCNKDTFSSYISGDYSDYKLAQQCYNKGINTSAVDMTSFKLSDGDSVDPGTIILVGLLYDYEGTGKSVIETMNTRFFYSKANMSLVTNGTTPFNMQNTKWYPYSTTIDYDDDGNEVQKSTNKFNISTSIDTANDDSILTQWEYNTSGTVLNSHQKLIYYAVKVNDDATAGSTMTLKIGEQQSMTDAGYNKTTYSSSSNSSAVDGNGRVYLAASNISIKVSGGSTSTDNTLKSLVVSQDGTSYAVDSTTPFSSGSKTVKTYLYYVPYSVNDIDIKAVANDTKVTSMVGTATKDSSTLIQTDEATTTTFITENNALSVGMNTYTIAVTAASGDVETYTINVYRLNNDASLKNLTADGITLTAPSTCTTTGGGTCTYTGTTNYDDTSTTISATLTDSNATIASGTGSWTFTSSGSTPNTKDVIVQAENCKSQYSSITGNSCSSTTYRINITRTAPATDATLSDLKVDGTTIGGFASTTYEYNYGNVANSKTSVTIAATLTDSRGKITSGIGTCNLSVGDNTCSVETVAQDGTTTKEYKVNIHRLSNEIKLNTMTVTSSPAGTLSPAFSSGFTTGDYTYTYDPTVSTVTVSATVMDVGKAKIGVADSTKGAPTSYTYVANTTSLTVNVPATTSVTFSVQAEDGTVQNYKIILTRSKDTVNYLSALTVTYEKDGTQTATLSPTFSSTREGYTATVPADVSSVVVTPTKQSAYSKVTKIGTQTGTDLTSATISNLAFGTNSIPVVVANEAGNEKTYTITLTRQKYSIKTLDNLTLGDGFTPTFDSATETYTYSSTVPFGTTSLPISGTITNEYATIAVAVNGTAQTSVTTNTTNHTFSGTVNLSTGSNTVTVVVTAHDGTTKTYTINVTRAKNNDSSVTSVRVQDQISCEVDTTDSKIYHVILPYNKKQVTPSDVAVGISSDATLTKGSTVTGITTTSDSEFTFRVTAEDGTYTDYTIKLRRQQNDEYKLLTVTLAIQGGTSGQTSSCTIASGATGCTIGVPTTTTGFAITSTVSENATKDVADGTIVSMPATDSTKTFTITVTAEDGEAGHTQAYTITVERTLSSTNTLSDLTVSGITVSGFTPGSNNYTNTQAGTVTTVEVGATVTEIGKEEITKATVNGTEVTLTGTKETGIYKFDAPLNFGSNAVVITVKAENSQTQNYNLTITRSQRTNAQLKDIAYRTSSDDEYSTVVGFVSTTGAYTLPSVSYDTTSIQFKVEPEDELGSAMITSVTDEKGTVTATNIADSSSSDDPIYTATVNLSTGTNTIIITGTAHNGTTTKTYTLTISRTKNDDNAISDLKVKGVTATVNTEDTSGKTYDVTLPNTVTSIDTTAGDITVTLPTGATVAYTPATKTLSTQAVNIITMVVTSEKGTPETYTININREKATTTALEKVQVTITSTETSENGRVLTCEFATSKQCTIDVPTSTNGFTFNLVGDALTSGGTTDPVVPKTYEMPNTQSVIEIPITVTAEDGTTKDESYKVTINRAKSSNNNLSDISYKFAESESFTTINGFSPGTSLYRLSVPGDQEQIYLSASVQDAGKATILTDLSDPFELALGRTTTITIEVESENGNVQKYYVDVTRSRRTDATLKMITVDGTDISTFNPTTTEYTIEDVPYSTTQLNIQGILNDQDELSNAKVTGGGIAYLNTGSNTVKLTVTADDGTTTKDYYVKVTRTKNSDTSITAVTLAGVSATYNSTDDVWEVSVNNSVAIANTSNVTVTPAAGARTTDALATYTVTSTNLSTQTTTDVPIVVTAEDGTLSTKVLRVTRAKSSVATLHTLTVDGGSFSPSFVPDSSSTVRYTVTIPEAYESVKIGGTPTDTNANVVGFGTFNFAGNTTYTVNVTSEDGTDTTTYYLDIVRASSTVNTLKSLVVSSGSVLDGDYVSYTLVSVEDGAEGFSSETVAYKVTLPGDIETVDISAETSDSRATITNASTALGSHSYTVGTHTQQIRVQSESGSALTYFLTIERLAKPYNKLSNLTVDYNDGLGASTVPGFDPDVDEYTLSDVANTQASIVIGAELADSDASVTGTGTCDLVVGANTCKVVVTAQNGIKKTYKINVTRKASDNNLLSLLSVQGYTLSPAFNSGQNEYTVTVKATDTTLAPSQVTAIAQDSTATVTKDAVVTLVSNAYTQYKVTVTSATGKDNVYTIRVFKPYSSDATLSSVNLTNATLNGTITAGTLNYTIYVPHGTTSFKITGVPTVSSTTVISGNGEYALSALDESKQIQLVTLAEDNTSTLTYTFTVEEALSNDATLSTLYVMGYPFTGTYTSFIPAIGTYEIGDIDYSVSTLNVVATATNTSSSIKYYVNGTLQTNNEVVLPPGTGSGSIVVSVMAADGHTSKNYSITYNKVYSKNAYLAYLGTDTGSLTPSFTKGTTDYTIVVGEDVTEINLTMYTEDENATMRINGGTPVAGNVAAPYTYTASGLTTGTNAVSIVVSPQDTSGTGKTYNIVIRKSEPAANSDSTLQSLEVVDHPFTSVGGYTTTTFQKDVTDYHIGTLHLKDNKLKINYTTTQSGSTTAVLVGGVAATVDSDGYITIPQTETSNSVVTVQVTAPNGSSITNYNIHYAKVASTNAFLANIVVANGTLDDEFYRETYSYKDTVSDETLSETITITPEDESATITVNGTNYTTYPIVYSVGGLTAGTKEIAITVTSESGNVAYYYVNIYKAGGGEAITSNEHGHTIADGYIETVAPNKTAGDFKDELDNDNSKLEIWKADDSAQIADTDLVGTGMIVKLKINGLEADRKIIIVKGDSSGDGKITITDVVKTLNHYLGKTLLPAAPYIKAADINDDNNTTITDVVKTLNHYLGKVLITTYK